MIHWRIGTVAKIDKEREQVQFIQVQDEDGATMKAVHYTDVQPLVRVGSKVLINTTAVDLQLGSGGYHFVYMIIDDTLNEKKDGGSKPNHIGHIMKLRYTPQQRSVLTCEEPNSPTHTLFLEDKSLEETPVLIGELHSMLPILCSWLHYKQNQGKTTKHVKICYVMSEGGALPISFSEHVACLKDTGWIDGTVTYGHTYGGDIEAVNKFTALIAAKHILKADIIIVLMGPGIVGTGTKLGHTGIEIGEIANAVSILQGIPIIVPRISFMDHRERHRGISHHLLTTLSTIALKQSQLYLPYNLPQEYTNHIEKQITEFGVQKLHVITWYNHLKFDDIEKSLNLYPFPIKTMGRGLYDDPAFFLAVCCAAQAALEVLMQD
ncbi:DUF3866 family protein [Chengkuizengella axinellae]|uniref:DUF3866 family protein n=1 Tax=Chengkuizengella axinellae TaxID=3064388 RepID=A0ABT9IW97_9BACL|nr:DUF3866 family protein [Chengkuizengella sp. 2205SS18-9]MDP5273638.1 DUF3866 family protein [Chengkuizengella sp. 2205SS18-9]